MRGDDPTVDRMFSDISPQLRVAPDHPSRGIRRLTHEALRRLSPQFSMLNARIGRPSIAPEKLLCALLLQVLCSVRSQRQLMEQSDYNLLFRWFVGLNMDDRVWSATTFSKNRQRSLDGAVAQAFFVKLKVAAEHAGLLSAEHFSVDGTLLEAYASLKSVKSGDAPPPRDEEPGNPPVDFGGQRLNQTHQSTTDPESRLFRKANGQAARLACSARVLMDNLHGLVVDTATSPAAKFAEREDALAMVCRPGHGGAHAASNHPPTGVSDGHGETDNHPGISYFSGPVTDAPKAALGCRSLAGCSRNAAVAVLAPHPARGFPRAPVCLGEGTVDLGGRPNGRWDHVRPRPAGRPEMRGPRRLHPCQPSNWGASCHQRRADSLLEPRARCRS